MSDKNEYGYKPAERGYKPSEKPKVDMPNEGKPGAGYQPTTSEGDNPGNPPKKP